MYGHWTISTSLNFSTYYVLTSFALFLLTHDISRPSVIKLSSLDMLWISALWLEY